MISGCLSNPHGIVKDVDSYISGHEYVDGKNLLYKNDIEYIKSTTLRDINPDKRKTSYRTIVVSSCALEEGFVSGSVCSIHHVDLLIKSSVLVQVTVNYKEAPVMPEIGMPPESNEQKGHSGLSDG